MKDKEKQIEEIAQIIHNSLPDIYTTKLCEKGDCIADKVFDKPCWCIYKEIAEKIYYKIFSEDSVVLSGLELAGYKHYKEYTKSLAIIEKETAEKIIIDLIALAKEKQREHSVEGFNPNHMKASEAEWYLFEKHLQNVIAPQFNVEIKE